MSARPTGARATVVAAAVVAGVGLPPVGATPATAAPTPAVHATVAGSAAYPCRSFGSFPAYNPAASAAADRFAWPAGRVTKVGNGRHDIDWKIDPYRDDSWRTWLNTLMWAGSLVEKSTRGLTKDRDPGAIDHAVAIAADWTRDNPYPWPTGPGAGNAAHTRVDFLICVRAGLQQVGKPVPAWLDTSLLQHATWLRAHTWKDHNVGTEQTLAVLGVGCVLRRDDLRTYAATKLSGDITRVVDAQGANNEQSIGYARWNWDLWGDVQRAFATCGVDTPATRTITARRAALATFLDHATKPDGNLAVIGDTQTERAQTDTPAQRWILSDGATGAPPAGRVMVYAAGYVFGRSGWGRTGRVPSQESMYALHFGPVRVGHGHNDHMSFTWNTRGRAILTDSGTGTYTNGPWREHYTGPSAHNQLVVPRMRTSQATRLTRSVLRPGADSFQLVDAPLKEVRRTRDVIFLSDPDLVVTVDRATSSVPTSFAQTWHLPSTTTAKATAAGVAVAAGAGATTVLRLPVAGASTPRFALTRGASAPIQGWEWLSYFVKRPAPVVTATVSGRSATIATAIVPSRPSERVAVSTKVAGAVTLYTFRVGAATAVVSRAANGTLTRVG